MGVAVAGDVADAVCDDWADAPELKSALAAMSIASDRIRTYWVFIVSVPPGSLRANAGDYTPSEAMI
jgi:hypothetical protein